MSKSSLPPSVGVILPGGGARGAYQAGSVLYLAEFLAAERVPIAALAGASVGAINGSVLASAPSFLVGARRLCDLWRAVGRLPSSQLELFRALPSIDLGVLLSLLFAAGESTGLDRLLLEVGRTAGNEIASRIDRPALQTLARFVQFDPSIKIDPHLQTILKDYSSAVELDRGIPFYVSLYPTAGALMDSARFVLANLTTIDTESSRLVHIQSLPYGERRDAILASAAIPFIFEARSVQGQHWSDGSLGGWRAETGQVPARDLCDRQAIDMLFVLHCSDASLWDRRGATLPPTVEVRPSQVLSTGRPLDDLFASSNETIEQRLALGYEDARRSIERLTEYWDRAQRAGHAKAGLRAALDDLEGT